VTDVPLEQPYVRAVWGNRPTTPQLLAETVLALLESLATIDPLLTQWMVDEATPVPQSGDELASMVERRAGKRKLPGEAWRLTIVSNGGSDESVSLTVREGNEKPHWVYLNEVVVAPSPTFDGRAFFDRHGGRLLECVVRVWHPDFATFMGDALHAVQKVERRRPPVGGLTWFADHLGPVPPVLPEGARTRRLANGTLVDLLEDDGALPQPDRVAEVVAWLERVGLRDPLPQVQPQVVA